MPYIPNTEADRNEMLKAIGVEKFEDLLTEIPEDLRLKDKLNLPKGQSEMEVTKDISCISRRNRTTENHISFLGGGSYDHYIPSIVGHIISRPEFQTAYTPYQAEVSQGTLQSIYEFQTYVCNITGMDVANASMYDGATALAEAISLSCGQTKKNRVILASTIHPSFIKVVKTFVDSMGIELVIAEESDGTVALDTYKNLIDENTAAVCVSNPNFYGNIEDLEGIADAIHENKGLFVVCIDPISVGLLKKPGQFGADIVVAEGQGLGLPQAFGGPYLGLFATTKKLMRKVPGRLVGMTDDIDGKRGFVLTLQTREQHIRRAKATSNICSNQALCALAASVYMATMGEEGLKDVAKESYLRAHYLADEIKKVDGFELKFNKPFFKEFVVKSKYDIDKIIPKMIDKGVFAGINMKTFGGSNNEMLVAVTEKRSKPELDIYVNALKEVIKEL